jgi:hypothetical protein
MRTENRPAIMHPRSFARRWMRRALTLPLMFVVVALVLFDDLFRPWVKSAVARLARLPLWRWIESRIARLSPYAALTLFLIPVAIIEPLKIYALYLMGLGHVIAGVLTLVVAKIVGVGLAERLFAASRDNLLSIPWFAWCFSRAVALKDIVHGWITRSRAWTMAKRLATHVKEALWRLRAWAGRALGGGRGRLARQVAALRLRFTERRQAQPGMVAPAKPQGPTG